MIILENTKEYKDNKLAIPVGIGVLQTEAVKNFYNTSDADATSADILINKTAYGKYGKLTGTIDLENEKEISYQDGYETGKVDGYAEGLDDGITDGRNQIIEEQSDANITASDVTLGKIGYGANNERIVGTSEAITSIDVGAIGIKFAYSTFSEIPSYYDFSNCTNMHRMFYECSKLTSVPLFDTSKVTTMDSMFYYCSNLTSIPAFDTSNVTNMNVMFYLCNVLTTVPELNCQSITSQFNYNFYAPFGSCSKLESFGGFKDLGKNFTGSSSKTFYMGTNNQALTHESMINTFNGLYDLTTTSYTGTATFWVSKYPYDNLTEDDIAIATAKGWVISRYDG